MIRQYTMTERERDETQEHINICQNCPFPMSKCNGECDYYKKKAKLIREAKRLKKKVIVF